MVTVQIQCLPLFKHPEITLPCLPAPLLLKLVCRVLLETNKQMRKCNQAKQPAVSRRHRTPSVVVKRCQWVCPGPFVHCLSNQVNQRQACGSIPKTEKHLTRENGRKPETEQQSTAQTDSKLEIEKQTTRDRGVANAQERNSNYSTGNRTVVYR